MNRRIQILTAILALQLLVVAIVFWPRPAASGGEGESLFPDAEAERIVALTITDVEGESIRLAKRNGSWVLPEADDYPVLDEKVDSLLDRIVGLEAARLVAQTSTSYGRLKVAEDEFERLVEFELDGGTTHRFYVGTSPSFRAAHIRAEGQDQVYLTSELSAQDVRVTAADWVGRDYVSIPMDQVVAVTVENTNGRLEFVKEGDSWTMKDLAADETLDEGSVNALVNRTQLTRMLGPLGKEERAEYGLQEPSAVVTVHTQSEEGDKTYMLRVGAQDPEDSSYVFKSSESEYHVRVGELTVKDFVEKARADFLELPPTPTPESSLEATPSSGP